MFYKPTISLQIPELQNRNYYFSLPIKDYLIDERDVHYPVDRIFVVSDIEGNFSSFCKLLIKVKVIDRKLQWIFGEGHLVINGDCFDRGNEVTECLWLIYFLEEKAKKAGGYIHFILGNHEIMNLNGDWRYIHPKYAEKRPGSRYPATALYDGCNELWRWLLTKNIMEKIGRVLFVHAGISPELLALKPSIQEVNNAARPFYREADESFEDPLLQAIFSGASSPFWYRGYYREGEATEELIEATLAHFDVHTIVTGHTMVERVGSFFNGKVINVNTDHAAGQSEGLLIKSHRFYRMSMLERRERLK